MLRMLSHATDFAKACKLDSSSAGAPKVQCTHPGHLPCVCVYCMHCHAHVALSGAVLQWQGLSFKLSARDEAAAAEAKKHRAKLAESFNTSVLAINDMGANKLKKNKASPDAFAQVQGVMCCETVW